MNVKEVLEFEVKNMTDSVAEDVLNYILSFSNNPNNTGFTKIAQKYSEAAFSEIWDNDEDSEYDKL